MTGFAFRFAPDASHAAGLWLKSLKSERRLAANTLEAYGRDVGQFAAFLQDHLGAPAGLADLEALTASDFRGFLARRRGQGVESRTLSRQLSAIRSFFRFGERNGLFRNAALSLLQSPKLPHAVPKPLSIENARRVAARRYSVYG